MCLRVLGFLLAASLLGSAADLPRKNGPIESYPGIDVQLGQVALRDGTLLRTVATRPRAATGKLPVVFFVGWLSCDSMEATSDFDGFSTLTRRVVQAPGYMTFRVDKPGVGDSQGDCSKTDFTAELAGYRAAFRAMLNDPRIDTERIVILGMSNGGGMAPLVAEKTPVRGYISVSGWGRTWYEHMLEHERRRLELAGKDPAEVTRQMQLFSEFYDEYLNRKKTPGEVLAAHPEMKSIWYDKRESQYGRPAAFYQQLQALNLAEVWASTRGDVLVIRGKEDWIMSHADAIAIVDAAEVGNPDHQDFIELAGDHGMMVHGSMYAAFKGQKARFDEGAADAILDFLRKAR
jgi:pimeloyl-ACP methyl ester carboxylesterase